jgi:hypothetical protein
VHTVQFDISSMRAKTIVVCGSGIAGNVRERDVADLNLLVGPLRTVSLCISKCLLRLRGALTLLNSLMLPISWVTSLGSTG